ncbi:hydrogenase formation protein HypD [Synechococcus sp. BSF8S]|uniref:hydrogenase formation protein HypD n=1 Tax=Synechococcales TaxID=1890424 RepID=UPI0016286114|nr:MULTISPECIES: hydrogenase formation protein HypD [unclassified Synechococcus]MBC1261585.1 hydrogenase formation protein HypD [Synechococcus sp. BSF8S]MBC1264514.1 hydrogenase formation protein HypD [Synechococcus sp. BSA11S]
MSTCPSSSASAPVHHLLDALHNEISRSWTLMEVCGGQTHAILRHGLDQLIPRQLELIHGPGCPVCVTAAETIDRALQLASLPEVILCSYGDMLRVPGSGPDHLLQARAAGADVRLVTAPLDALALARAHPERQVVFFAVGFETTAPATALLAHQALSSGTQNLSLLVAHVRVPPAMEAILAAPHCRVQGFLAAGHVCTVMGRQEYEPIAARHRLPIVITGFEPIDLLEGMLRAVRQLERGEGRVEDAYPRAGAGEGNATARALIEQVFAISDQHWRGLGVLPGSGLRLRRPYDALDAEHRFPPVPRPDPDSGAKDCISGQVLQGLARPDACPRFGRGCSPERPLGAPMVSSEGACAAYWRYRTRA